MSCTPYLHLLDDVIDGALDADLAGAMERHLLACAHCRAELQALRALRSELAAMPVPSPRPGFEARVLRVVPAAGPLPRTGLSRRVAGLGLPLGLAAGLLLAVLLVAGRQGLPEFDPAAGEPLRLVFRSDSALTGVRFELELPEGVELAGYPGQRRVSWQSDLQAGTNLLELPVHAAGAASGVVVATLNHGADSRRFAVRVVAGGDRA